jgi:hypothetical protein
MGKQTIAAGFKINFYGVTDSDGYFIGGTATAPVAGNQTGSGMIRLRGSRTIPLQIPEPTIDTVLGDDEPEVSFEFDADSLPDGVLETSVRSNVFEALAQKTKVRTLGDLEVSVIAPANRGSESMCYLLSRRAKSWAPGTEGVKKWESVFIPRASTTPLFTNIEQRTFTPYQYKINLSKSGRTGWSTVSTNLHGTTAAPIFPIDSDNPLYLHRWTGDAAETAFTLTYPPVSGAKTYVFVNDILQTVTTDYTVSGKILTFEAGSTPASDAVIIALAEISESDLD